MNPTATNHPISYFRKYYQDDQLDLSPVFQRNPVWTDSQASYLIDSILNDLPIPEIFVRSTTEQSGTTMLEVVDGQQRLRSIIRFFSGELELSGESVSPKWIGTSWESLNSADRERFWAYKVVVRELEGATDAEVRDMFRRLNANQSNLNSQELRHSQYHGEFISCVEDLANDRWWLDHKLVTPAQIRRMLDVEFIAEMLVAMMAGPLDKKQGLDDYFRDYDEEFPDSESWKNSFIDTRDRSKKIVGGSLAGWTSKTEYYSLFVAVGRVVADDRWPKSQAITKAVERLKEFRMIIDKAKRKGSRERVNEIVRSYVESATRASTDLSRREYRIETVYKIITDPKFVFSA